MPPAAPLPLNRALLGGYDLTVTMIIAGEVHKVEAAKWLAEAISRNTLKVHRRGFHGVETRVDVPILRVMRVSLVVSVFADSATATQVQFNNDIAMGASGSPVRYESIAIAQGGQQKFRLGALVQYQYQSWCTTVWHGACGIGANTFRPGPGYNICRSGAGPAVFEVDAAAGGTMEVLNFKPTGDKMRFLGAAVGSSAGVLSGATMRGADTHLILGRTAIRLVGVPLSQLNASHLG